MVEYEVARRTPRFRFIVDADVTDLHGTTLMKARTTTLGLFGCGIDTSNPLIQGTSVRIRLFYRGTEVKALGMVVYSRPDLGMGISFIDINKEDERILGLWIQELMRTERVT